VHRVFFLFSCSFLLLCDTNRWLVKYLRKQKIIYRIIQLEITSACALLASFFLRLLIFHRLNNHSRQYRESVFGTMFLYTTKQHAQCVVSFNIDSLTLNTQYGH
jgi:hypothetical protein